MSDTVLERVEPQPPAIALRRAASTDGRLARSAFGRMLGLLWPHRRPLLAGLLLGTGVALTYTANLVGLLPVLKVLVEGRNLHDWLLEHAAAKPTWYSAWLQATAGLFPAASSPEALLRTLLTLLLVLVGINLAGNAFRVLSQYLVLYASNRMLMDLRRRMYRKALHVPLLRLAGDVSERVNQFMSDTREVFVGVTTLLGKIAREPLKAACVLAVALWFDWKLTAAFLLIGPPAVALLWLFGRRVRRATVRLLQGYGGMLSSLEETLQGLDLVKGYGREGHERRRLWQLERRMLRQQMKLVWIEALTSPAIEVLGILAASAGILWLAARTFHGEITPAHFMLMVGLMAALLDPLRKIAAVYNMVQRAGAASARIFEFLDQPEERSPRRARTLPWGSARDVRFENVTFRYTPEQTPPALDNVSLHVRAGECVAIVGPNGSGKSTLLRLPPRLIEPQSGGVRIDGIDVRELGLRDLRQQIAIVSQRPVVFARSVRENIAYGNEAATLAQIREAAGRAHIADFIESLPDGYETVLGEFGTSLSGGQRQRLALARAFLRPATILIFDEATSEVDADCERRIHDALMELRQGKTTFLIAHRHTVMELAERIVVMDAGRIIDVGPHAELLARCPLYVALYRSPAA